MFTDQEIKTAITRAGAGHMLKNLPPAYVKSLNYLKRENYRFDLKDQVVYEVDRQGNLIKPVRGKKPKAK